MPFSTNPKIQLVDASGDAMDGDDGRLKVTTEQDDAFSAWTTYDDVAIGPTANHLNGWLGLTGGSKIADAKEILIQLQDEATGYIIVGAGTASSSSTAVGSAGSRHGIKINPGQILILALSDFDKVWIDGSDANQYTTIAYFK